MSRPGVVVALDGAMAEVDVAGRRAWFNALMVPGLKPGAWVLTHTSLVISEIKEKDARAVEELLREGAETAS